MDKRKIKEDNIIDECYRESILLLEKNSNQYGLSASTPNKKATKRNYNNIFSRDSSISSLGIVLTKNKKLINSAKKSIIALSNFQAYNGQIPNYVNLKMRRADFWYFGCIDATLWWLIAIKYYDKYSRDKINLTKKLEIKIKKAIYWAECQEHQKFFLLQQNEASDWADIMPRSGYVLYTNVLWYWIKKLYNLKNIKETKESFNYIFNYSADIPSSYFNKNHRAKRITGYIKKTDKKDLLLSFVNYSTYGKDVDVYGNILAILVGLVNEEQNKKIINYFLKNKINKPYLVKSTLNPILKRSKEWRLYMETYNQNKPNQYHNGGIWSFIGGFWLMALNIVKKKELAKEEFKQLARVNKINNWDFNEWFHGKTGKPMGMSGQSWNAGVFLLAYHYLKGDFKL